MIVIILILAPSIILLFLIISKIKHSKYLVKEFNFNKKEIENLDISDYKLGSGHIYQ